VELSESITSNAAVMCRGGLAGKDVKVSLDAGCYKVTGTGIALGSCALDCDTALWQVRVGAKPEGVRVGVKRYNTKKPSPLVGHLEGGSSPESLLGAENEASPSWTFKGRELKTGDVVGVYWDHTDLPMLSFTVNGEDIPEAAVMRIRPAIDIFPAVSLEGDGSSCELIFDEAYFVGQSKSSKFKMIVCATSLI